MPYIDNSDLASTYKVYATDMLGGLLNILVSNGWAVAKTFRKDVVYYNNSQVGTYDYEFHINKYHTARHTILRSPHGKYVGFAEIGDVISVDETPTVKGRNAAAITDAQWKEIKSTLNAIPFKSTSKQFYMYLMENVAGYANNSHVLETNVPALVYSDLRMVYPYYSKDQWGGEFNVLRSLLDVEYCIEGSNGILKSDADAAKLYANDVRQSPFVLVDYFKYLGIVDDVVNTSNLWGDTELSVQGRVDGDGFFFAIQGDSAVAPTNNVMANYPIFYGEIIDTEGRTVSDCLFAGSMPSNATFDFTSDKKFDVALLMPTAKTYPKYPSDGVNTVMVKRGRRGSRYQAHYLSWGATPATMPPKRDNAGKQYPRSWTSDVQNYGLQPSRYSQKVQTSYIYVVHPEEGVIGRIKNIVGLQILTTSNPELRILKEACPVKVRETFKTVQISAISPFTKRPATVYPVMSLAVKKSVVERVPNAAPKPVDGLAKSTVDGLTTIKWTPVTDPFVEYFNIYKGSELLLPRVSDVSSVVVEGTGTFGVEAVDFKGKKSTLKTV